MFFPLINADVISINPGGSGNIIVNPHELIEGFFSGIPTPTVTPVCGNGVIETGETCDDGNTVSGDGCSSTCTTEVPGEEPPGDGGDVGALITVSPTEFNINLAINTNVNRTITIKNLRSEATTISVSQQDLDQNVILPVTELTLNAGETKEITVTFVGTSKTGIYTGSIIIGDRKSVV